MLSTLFNSKEFAKVFDLICVPNARYSIIVRVCYADTTTVGYSMEEINKRLHLKPRFRTSGSYKSLGEQIFFMFSSALSKDLRIELIRSLIEERLYVFLDLYSVELADVVCIQLIIKECKYTDVVVSPVDVSNNRAEEIFVIKQHRGQFPKTKFTSMYRILLFRYLLDSFCFKLNKIIEFGRVSKFELRNKSIMDVKDLLSSSDVNDYTDPIWNFYQLDKNGKTYIVLSLFLKKKGKLLAMATLKVIIK